MKLLIKKFIRWMRYNPPAAASADEWVQHERDFKKNAPVRYFIVEKLFDGICFPLRRLKWRIEKVCLWIRYRIFDKYHIVNTKLAPGYYDTDQQMLHACFSLLVDYVEIGCASRSRFSDVEEYKKQLGLRRFIPYYLDFFATRKVRRVEAGMKYLEWETTLTQDSPWQAERAKEVIELYKWWTEQRPIRSLPECPDVDREDDHILVTMTKEWKEKHPEKERELKEWSEEYNRLEREYLDEDQEMLARLVKIRPGLWS